MGIAHTFTCISIAAEQLVAPPAQCAERGISRWRLASVPAEQQACSETPQPYTPVLNTEQMQGQYRLAAAANSVTKTCGCKFWSGLDGGCQPATFSTPAQLPKHMHLVWPVVGCSLARNAVKRLHNRGHIVAPYCCMTWNNTLQHSATLCGNVKQYVAQRLWPDKCLPAAYLLNRNCTPSRW